MKYCEHMGYILPRREFSNIQRVLIALMTLAADWSKTQIIKQIPGAMVSFPTKAYEWDYCSTPIMPILVLKDLKLSDSCL